MPRISVNRIGIGLWLRRYAPILVIAVLVIGGCDACRVTVPESDETPPNVILLLSGPGVSEIVSRDTGPKSVNLSRDKEYFLSAFAVDSDGGVKIVSIGGGMTVYCASPKTGLGQIQNLDYYVSEPAHPTDLNTGQSAPTIRMTHLTLNENGQTYSCGSGFEFVAANGFFVAAAENYNETSADTPALSIHME